eukprot:scaffold34603_cov212-Amphora_coffeaeformis.AAC.16
MSSSPMDRKNYKCPCCNNPWGAATGEFFAKLCQACDETKKPISRENMDTSVLPSTNFYQYSNGKWLEAHPIPPCYPNWNNFLVLHSKSQEKLKALLEELRDKSSSATNDDDDACTEEETKVAAFFAAAMDEAAVEAASVEPVRPILDAVDKAVEAHKDGAKTELARLMGFMALEFGVSFFFGIGVSPDNGKTDHSILQVAQGGLGLPDRDYYFNEAKQEQRETYRQAVAFMLTLLVDPSATEATEECNAAAMKVFDLENSLAESHMTKTENRDPHATFNKMTVSDFVKLAGAGFDFVAYLEAATGKTAHEGLGEINIRNVEALKRVAEVVSAADAATLEYYMRWHVVKSCAPYLSQALVRAHFDFYEKTLMGTQEIKPRWKRALAFTETALGEALGKLYCAKYFDEESSKEWALAVADKVRQALEARLKEVDWMKADSTRSEALKKMSKFGGTFTFSSRLGRVFLGLIPFSFPTKPCIVKIIYPDKWTDYGSLVITLEMSFLEMVLAARKFDRLQDIKEINAPTDKIMKWLMSPQTINA